MGKNIILSPKLRSYSLYKSHLVYENYLSDIFKIKYRKALTILRTSTSHCLKIETGCYTSPKTPLEDRLCACGDMEDELHFITKCALYEQQRIKLYHSVIEQCPNFINLTNEDKLMYLMSAEGTVIKETAKFCSSGQGHKELPPASILPQPPLWGRYRCHAFL